MAKTNKIVKTDDDDFAKAIENYADTVKDSEAKAILKKGIPIYYSDNNTPEGLLIKEYPDGTKQLVRFNYNGDEVIKTYEKKS